MKAILEQVSLEAVSSVEPLRVAAVQPVHSLRQSWFVHRQREVEVIRHEAVGQAAPRGGVDSQSEQYEEALTVDRVEEDVGLAVPA
jgi:hypothetical protein